MSVRAYILIETAAGEVGNVAGEIRKLGSAVSVDVLTGPYDVIVVADLPDLNSINGLVGERMNLLAGIKKTVTCIAVRPM